MTEESPGQPLSSEIITLSVPTLSCQGEGHMKMSVQREFLFNATESQTLCMVSNSHSGNRETSTVPCGENSPMGRSVKATSRTADMHGAEESDGLIVPAKRANKTGTPAAECVEGRGSAKGNEIPMATRRTLCRVPCGVCRDRVRQVSCDATDRQIPKARAV